MFRILASADQIFDECFEFSFGDGCFDLASEMRFGANVSKMFVGSDRCLEGNACQKPGSANVSKNIMKYWTTLPHVQQRSTNLTNVSNFLHL